MLSEADVKASLEELAAARQRPYYDEDADRAAAAAYYGELTSDELADYVTRTHQRKPVYKPAREVYPWVDLQPNGSIRSLYTGQEFHPEVLIRADVDVAAARARTFASRLGGPGRPRRRRPAGADRGRTAVQL